MATISDIQKAKAIATSFQRSIIHELEAGCFDNAGLYLTLLRKRYTNTKTFIEVSLMGLIGRGLNDKLSRSVPYMEDTKENKELFMTHIRNNSFGR